MGGTDGNSSIDNWAHDVLISLPGGNNYIYSYSTNGTIISGDGDDFLENHGDSNLSGTGNDSLENRDGSKLL